MPLPRLLAGLGLVAIAAIAAAAGTAAGAPPASGDWVVTGTETYADQTIVVHGNVYVRAPGHLTLINVTLEVNSTVAARRGVVVEAGATLRTRDRDNSTVNSSDRTVIRPLSTSERITFVAAPNSSVDLQQTALWGVGYTQSPLNASAVFLQTNSTVLRNVSVYASYYGIYFQGVTGSFEDLAVHNNTYDGLEVDAASNVSVFRLVAADNGGAGVHIPGGRFFAMSASIYGNGDGLAVKFDGSASVVVFDASGNGRGLVALNNATLYASFGRVTNSTTTGMDARLASRVFASTVTVSDNPLGLLATGASSVDFQSGAFFGGINAVQLRTGATATFTDVAFLASTGDALDFDSAQVDFFSCRFESNAFGGTITGGSGFGFFDSSLSNSSGGGFTFVNAPGVFLNNPRFFNNRGTAVDLVGTTNALLAGGLVAEVNRSVVEVRQLNVLGTLKLVDATVHAVAVQSWTVAGLFSASNASIVGDVAGASLTVAATGQVFLRSLRVVDFDLRLQGPTSTDVDGLAHTGSGELASTGGVQTWRNVSQGPGGGRVRVAASNLTVVAGSIVLLSAQDGGSMDLHDVTADLVGASYAGSGRIQQYWSTSLETLWQVGVPAPNQPYSVENFTSAVVGSGTTNGTGNAALGVVHTLAGTTAGVSSSNPHRISAGSGAWVTVVFANITAPSLIQVLFSEGAPPAVVITAPTQGASLSADPVVIQGNVSDGESGVASLAWSFDNVSFTAGALADPFALSVPALFETTYQITVRAVDLAGNAAFATVSYRIDRTAPIVFFSTPVNGSTVGGPLVRFVGATEAGAALTINGSAVALDVNGDFDVNLTLADGDAVIGATAVDAAGNVYFTEVYLRVDATPPAIIVDSPADGATVAGLTVDLSGRVEPGASLSVDGVAQLLQLNGSFAVTVDLPVEGLNNLTLRSRDGAGNVNTTVWRVARDTRGPVVSVAGLTGPGPHFINTSAPDFSITTDEWAFIEASIVPGTVRENATGLFLLFRPALSTPSATLQVRATDAVGNSRSWNFSLRVDLTPPTFTLDARTESGFVNATPWRVGVQAEPGARVTVAGQAATPIAPNSASFEVTVTLSVGANAVVVEVQDSAGNVARRTLNLTLDVLAPALSIAAPAEGLSTSQDQVVVEGDTEPGATLTVKGRDVPVSPAGHFEVPVNLAFGSNSILIVSTDRAGNQATLERTVTRKAASGGILNVPFLADNLVAILLILVAAIALSIVGARGAAKRRALSDKAQALERDLEAARADRNDISALENFSPRTVSEEGFVSAEEFRRREAQVQGEAEVREQAGKRSPEP